MKNFTFTTSGNLFRFWVSASLLLFATVTGLGQCEIYVDQNVVGGVYDGTSWENAYTDLQQALSNICTDGSTTSIHVAQGTYYPTDDGDRDISFVMQNYVILLGGYPSGGGTRDWLTNETILSGAIGASGIEDNSLHVVKNNGLNDSAVLDGFVIREGNANEAWPNSHGGGMHNDASSPTIANCKFEDNSANYDGAGMYNINSDPSVSNCAFVNNNGGNGAGMFCQTSSPSLTNCVFALNSAEFAGGAMFMNTSDPILINCTFSNNEAPVGGGIRTFGASPTLTNCILWDNGEEVYGSGTPVVSYSIVAGGYAGTNNFDFDPGFVNATLGDLSLDPCSQAKGVGDNNANNTATDIAGNDRFFNTDIDLGAYESHDCCVNSANIYVDQSAAGGLNNGLDWDNAFTDLQDALNNICAHFATTTIHVAQGTYKPTDDGDREVSFVMYNNVEILGSYPSGGTGPRDLENTPSILSGEIGDPGNEDNSLHVVKNIALDDSAVLDGFIITAGNANTYWPFNHGGGMYNDQSDPIIRNCRFESNNAIVDGGGMYNNDSDPVIEDCHFEFNEAQFSGGGIAISNDSYLTLTNCTFDLNYGFEGGALYVHSSNAVITNCSFGVNDAVEGGAIFLRSSDPTLNNCSFYKNSSSSYGGAILLEFSSPTLNNCTLFDNTAPYNGSGIAAIGSTPQIRNCILWQNGDNEINDTENPIVTYSIVTGGHPGEGNLDVDPLFENEAAGDLSLNTCSPAKNVGNDDANSTSVDLAGNPRFHGTIDLGAYESQVCCSSANIYVDAGAVGLNNGGNWTNAFTDLQDALSNICPTISTTTIHVAQGTYYPTDGDDRYISFEMKNGVTILGGYKSGGSDPAERDWDAYSTFLSGNINAPDSEEDNSFHVIFNENLDNTAVLDGFTITGGYANGGGGSFPDDAGGGMINLAASPRVENCFFANNFANGAGGGMFNEASSPEIINCSFEGNEAAYNGGGIYSKEFSMPTLSGCSFSNNYAAFGAGMYNKDSNSTINNCEFNLNFSTEGGGIYNSSSNPILNSCSFIWNQTDYGGGMYNSGSAPSLVNCTFYGNYATNFGGGMTNYDTSSPALTNCTFHANSANVDSDGISNSGSSTLTLVNCILWDNGVEISGDGSGTEDVSYSIVQGGFPGVGNLDVDPLFTNTYSGDFHLLPCSPAKDAGTTSGAPATDFEGDIRPQGDGIDMGVDEAPVVTILSANDIALGSDLSCTDADGWTHYYNSSSAKLLLSLQLGNSGAVVLDDAVTIDPDGGTDVFWVNSVEGNFVNNTQGGAAFMKRKWNVEASTQPISNVGVRFYYTTEEYEAINNELITNTGNGITMHEELRMFKITNDSDPFDVATLSNTDGIDMGHGMASTTEWTYYAYGNDHYGEFYVDAFSGGGAGAAPGGGALPVEMLYIRGVALEQDNEISWATSIEDNTEYHVIERSLNGTNDWKEIGSLDAKGFSTETTEYVFLDKEPGALGYYRIKTLDYNGHVSISGIVVIERVQKTVKLLHVYPNPVVDDLNLEMQLTEEGTVTITVYDAAGRLLQERALQGVIGENDTRLNLSLFDAGMYFLEIDFGNEKLTRRIVRQ